MLTPSKVKRFQSKVYDYYKDHKRNLPWRKNIEPYSIVVSEIMLQQTQVQRVLQKYPLFMKQFSSFATLACAEQRDVLLAWSGLGYNRRARNLQQLAQKVVHKYQSKLPNDPLILTTFPGIGKATAASICAFAFNQPVVFIETNIRSVFIHEFFSDKQQVSDSELMPFIEQTLDRHNPREWYYALMDYGSMLKKEHGNPNTKSKQYVKQSSFIGSNRQLRGFILRELAHCHSLSIQILVKRSVFSASEVRHALSQLEKEKLIKKKKTRVMLA